MIRSFLRACLAGALLANSTIALAQADTARIIDEGLNRSQVMLTASELMDGIGSRLTNSPGVRRAEDWAIAKFQRYGLSNVHREAFDFGRGWEIVDVSATMIEPRMRADDLRQAAVVIAGVLLAAANSDKELPRPPLPTQPSPTDPFAYQDPDKL